MSSKLSQQAFPDPRTVEYQELVPDPGPERIPGLEYPDPTPVAVPSRHGLVTEGDRLRQLIVQELTQARADAAGIDSPEEADDFDVPDDDDFFPVSVYQMEEDYDHLGIVIPEAQEDDPPQTKQKFDPSLARPGEGQISRAGGASEPVPDRPEGDLELTQAEREIIMALRNGNST